MRRIAIIGIGCTKVGEHWDKALRDLAVEASLRAMEDVGLYDVDYVLVGNMMSGYLQNQEHLGALVADSLGLQGAGAAKIEAACASGGMAVHMGCQLIASGAADSVLVVGVEKMTDATTQEATKALAMAEDQEYSAYTGTSFVGLNALVARAYMRAYGVGHEDIARFPVICHKHALDNEFAQFRFPITVEAVMSSPIVADPLHLLECAGIGDGAAAVLLAPLEDARKIIDAPVEVLASTVSIDKFSLHQRDDLTSFKATRASAEAAFKKAGLGAEDIDVLEVHDAFSVLGLIALEDLGFAERGKAAELVKEGGIEIGGKIPTNTFGGLKARGHPVGATGVYQIVELVRQLRGEAGKNQVEGAERGYAQNIGGVGTTITAHILGRVD
ncbi:MAG: thiolase domain-containing protein [Candidatus Bathyarchaeia archaeon]